MLHPLVIGNDHYEVHSLATKLQTPASASNRYRGRRTPPMRGAACRNTLPVAAAEPQSNLDHGRNNRDAHGITHNLVRNSFVGGRHYFVQHIGGSVDAFINIGLIFIVSCPAHAAKKQNAGAEREEIPYYSSLEFHT